MIKIKMLKTRMGSEDGIRARSYVEGELYVVGESLAKSFINSKWAEEVKEKAKPKENKKAAPVAEKKVETKKETKAN